MSHAHDHDPTVPPAVLAGIGMLLATTLAFTAATSWGLLSRSAVPADSRADAQVGASEQRELRFADRADGAVVVSDAATGATVSVVEYGQGGFVRATLRRLARQRAARGIGSEPPFVLTRWENGALSLSDPQTGVSAELYGFGADHVRAFAMMLEGSDS
jgi:putative photosynthetic complex assembly protein